MDGEYRITIKLDPELKYHDTGGGFRDTTALILIDNNLSQRMKRKVALYETLGSLLEYSIGHDQLEDISDVLLTVLDQLEPCKEK